MECMRLRRERPVFMGRWQNFQVLELDRSLPVKAKGGVQSQVTLKGVDNFLKV